MIYTALKKLPKESQSKLTELVRLDTILGDSINVIWREIYERDKKGIKKIDVTIEMLYKARNEAIKSYDHYSLMMSEAKTKSEQNNTTKGTGLKIFTTKQMLQRLPIALAQVKAGNNSQNLLNEIRQNIYSLYQSKEITKSIQQLNKIFIKMDTIFMNSESSKTSEPHILKLKLTDKLDLKLDKRLLHYQILAFITNGIILKAHAIIVNLKNQHQHGMKNLHYQMDLIRYQIFSITLNTF